MGGYCLEIQLKERVPLTYGLTDFYGLSTDYKRPVLPKLGARTSSNSPKRKPAAG